MLGTAMAGSLLSRWRFVTPRLRIGSFLLIAARRFRNPDARRFATWPRPPKQKDLRRSPISRCVGCSRLNFRSKILT